VKLTLRSFDLPLKHVFTISRESVSVQPTLIVELAAEGHRGFGEATTNDYYGFTLENMTAAIESVRAPLEELVWDEPTQVWRAMAERLADNPFALCAIDQAAHDLWGKRKGLPVYRLWDLDVSNIPSSNFTIGIDTIDVMVSKLREMPDWPIYKIKLGTPDDLEIVRQLRRHTDAVFRVDANCGWGVEETLRNAGPLSELGVEFIEQPLPADAWPGYEQLFRKCGLPVIADESCIVEGDVQKCHGHFHGINIKLVKCGGLTPARRMIQHARQLDLKVMVGCMTESTVGISAIAQLLPLLDYVDMDGAVLLARDIAEGVRVVQGKCEYPDVNGTGVTLIG
jgi:L-alanine-DL-glutamate epimerase-like enolase superfamily enzyme